MNGILKNWIDNLAMLKVASMNIASQEDFSSDSIENYHNAEQNFINFVEGHKGAVRTYPFAQEVVDSFNSIKPNDNLDELKESISHFLNTIDNAIMEANNMMNEEKSIKMRDIIDSNIIIGSNNTQTIQKLDVQNNNHIFESIKIELKNEISDPKEQELILSKLHNFENSTRLTNYQEFMGVAANHMTILAPFLPVLAKLIS